MDKWEYLIEPLKWDTDRYKPWADDDGRSVFGRSFESLGRQRWELVQILPHITNPQRGIAYFKRPKKEDSN